MNTFIPMKEQPWVDLHHEPKQLSASQMASVLGQNPYESAWMLYMRKTGQVPWPTQTLNMRMGHTMEPIIDEYYQQERDVDTKNPGDFAISRSAALPGLFSTIDRMDKDDRVVELKTGNQWVKKNWKDGPPMGYRIQNQVQMHCVNVRHGAIAAFLGDNFKLVYGMESPSYSPEYMDDFMDEAGVKYVDFDFEWHEELCQTILEYAEAFIRRCVDRNPPDPDAGDLDVIRSLHPMDNGKLIEVDKQYVDVIEQWENQKHLIKAHTGQRKDAEALLLETIGPNSYLAADGRCVSFKHQTRHGCIKVSNTDVEAYYAAKKLLTEHNIKFTDKPDTTTRVLRNSKMPALEITG